MFYFFKTPLLIQKLFPNYLWSMPNDKKIIYLTFDDGPTPIVTDWVLNLLEKYHAKATFFCIGQNVEKHPNIFKNIFFRKHSIGNHTYSHLNGWKTKTQAYLKDIEKANKILFQETDSIDEDSSIANKLLLFRPPYGKIRPTQAKYLRKVGYKIIMLDVVSGDFDQNLNPEKSLKNTLKNTKSGSIVVFHDSGKAFKTLKFILPKFLEYWTLKGYKFISL